MGKSKKHVDSKSPARMVICWKCRDGLLVREQGAANDSGAIAICTLAKVIMRDPRNPPKACPIRKEWDAEDAASG